MASNQESIPQEASLEEMVFDTFEPSIKTSADCALSVASDIDLLSDGPELGGTVLEDAFFLLCGIGEDQLGKTFVCQYPITRLPLTLGRTHKSHDTNFLGLGPSKALSRYHCVIYYRDILGGRLHQQCGQEEIVYSPRKKKSKGVTTNKTLSQDDEEVEAEDIILPLTTPSNDKTRGVLPSQGFYVVKCLGKNKIVVGGQTVSKNQVALLTDGITLQLASHKLYFLLPVVDRDSCQTQPMMEIKNSPYGKDLAATTKTTANNVRKRSLDATFVTSVSMAPLGNEDEELSVEELMRRMSDAISNNQWERKHQMMGTMIAHHAVLDAAKSRECQKIAEMVNGTISRSEIMKWIKSSLKYSNWCDQMQSKMEFKSYQGCIGKALHKAGFERTGTTGRHVRWILPKDIFSEGEERGKDREDDNSEEGGDDEENGGEECSINVRKAEGRSDEENDTEYKTTRQS